MGDPALTDLTVWWEDKTLGSITAPGPQEYHWRGEMRCHQSSTWDRRKRIWKSLHRGDNHQEAQIETEHLENKTKSNIYSAFAKRVYLFDQREHSQPDTSLIIYHPFDSNAPILDGAWWIHQQLQSVLEIHPSVPPTTILETLLTRL